MHLRTNDNIFCCKLKSVHLKLLEDLVVVEIKMTAANEKGSRDSSMKNGCCLMKGRMPSHTVALCVFIVVSFYSFKCLKDVIVVIMLMEAIL